MDEQAFEKIATATLDQIETALEKTGLDLDIEQKPGGVLSVGLENGQVLILNRHSAMREIWLAAPTGGFHFRYGSRVLDVLGQNEPGVAMGHPRTDPPRVADRQGQ